MARARVRGEFWHQAADGSWYSERNGKIVELQDLHQEPMIDGYAELRANARKGALSS